MVLTRVRPREDGSLVLPAEVLRPFNVEPGSELVLEKANEMPAGEEVYLILRKPLIPEMQVRLRQQQVEAARASLDKISAHLDDPGMAMLMFYEFREALEQLWVLSHTAEKPYRQTITLLQMGARKLREERLKQHNLEALSAVLDQLKSDTLTDDSVAVCDDLLKSGGVDVMMELPTAVLQSYRKELGRDV